MRLPLTVKIAAAVLAGAAGVQIASRLLAARRMDDRTVFITGGSRGLGFAIALECARRGARVAICARNESDLARAAARLIAAGAQDVLVVPCDIQDAAQIQQAIDHTNEVFGGLDILVNNAGIIQVGPMECMTRRDYEDAMNSHFWAAYYAVEAARPIFERRGGGSIVNITSIGGKISVPHLLPYCVSKFAAVGYSQGLHAELARKNVCVTTVCPGLMRTGSPRNAFFKSQHEKEYAWFSLSDTLPFISISASAAARSIVDATLSRRAEISLSLPAQIGALVHGIAPGFTARALGVVARFLPGPGGGFEEAVRGYESESPITLSPLTALGRKAEREFNQVSE